MLEMGWVDKRVGCNIFRDFVFFVFLSFVLDFLYLSYFPCFFLLLFSFLPFQMGGPSAIDGVYD